MAEVKLGPEAARIVARICVQAALRAERKRKEQLQYGQKGTKAPIPKG